MFSPEKKNQASEVGEFRKKNWCILLTILCILCYMLGSLQYDFHLNTTKKCEHWKIINLNGIINNIMEIVCYSSFAEKG